VEGTSETELKYYFAGTIRIALREDEAITWLLSDHLGSTSVTVDASGNLLTSLKYTAFGELRSGTSTTDYQYTGQRNEVEIGLYYYVARFYDPQLARFISADTIIPEPGSSQGYDRYAYTHNNPINFNDPTGHRACDDDYGRGCNVVNPPGNGGGSGGGNNYGDDGSNEIDSPSQNTIVDDYIRGWQLVGTAWSIFNNPDAGWEAWGISGGYMLGWVGAHVALGVGVGGLVCVAIGPGCVAAVEGVLGVGGGVTAEIQKGTIVLGRYPEYLKVGKDIGAKTFNIPQGQWETLNQTERWALNRAFLDQAIARGDTFYLASKWANAKIGTAYRMELDYLFSKGYTISIYQNYLIPSSIP
jgi:RHS repeat-associated protein